MRAAIVLAIGTGACLASAAGAQSKPPAALPEKVDSHQPPSPAYGLTGDWGGLRTKLHDAGVDVSAGYTGEIGGNFECDIARDAWEALQFSKLRGRLRALLHCAQC